MKLTRKIVDVTRQLRKSQTPEEAVLWEKVRNRRVAGLKFLRQHPIIYGYRGYTPLFFVADFYCATIKLVIELDGKVHEFQKHYDQNRDAILNELGLKILRLKNEELNNPDSVLKKILEFSTHPPSPSLQSREGVSERREDGGELRGEFAILILAAGPSSRLGQPKQQLLIDGSPLLLRTVATALESNIGKVYVVIGYDKETHHKLLSGRQVEIIVNSNWKKGMGSSLKVGLDFILVNYKNLNGIMVMVSDQPLLTSAHLQQLMLTFKQTKSDIVASYYTGTAGVPVLFSKALFCELQLIADTEGAKKIIQNNLHKTSTVPFQDGAIDIDTPEDYERFLKSKAG